MNLINIIFSNITFFQISALLGGALFFFMVGIRELKNENLQGLLFLVIGVFFVSAHGFLLWDLTQGHSGIYQMNLWFWLIKFLAPTLIILSLAFGVFHLLAARFKVAFVKIMYGLALIGMLFMVGPAWPVYLQGLMVLIWCGLWFEAELKTAR
ncbi:membrane hypothetical protein [Candidatus Zixiibacteriota bacterium]|nr:membrane hypothetical protein [candidate division Zixibacteria bacterium]